MADPKAVLEALARVVGQTRGLGQTTAAVAVAAGAPVGARYVVADRNHADVLRAVPRAEGLAAVVALHNLPNDTRGHREPYVVDHHAVAVAAADGAREIERLRAEVATEKDRSARWEALFDGKTEEVRRLRAEATSADIAVGADGEHRWPERREFPTCERCWVARRADGANKPCPGKPPPIAVRVPAPGWDELDEAARGAELGAPCLEVEGAKDCAGCGGPCRIPGCTGTAHGDGVLCYGHYRAGYEAPLHAPPPAPEAEGCTKAEHNAAPYAAFRAGYEFKFGVPFLCPKCGKVAPDAVTPKGEGPGSP